MRIISLPLVGLMVMHISQGPGSILRSSFPTLMEFSFPQTTRCCSVSNTCWVLASSYSCLLRFMHDTYGLTMRHLFRTPWTQGGRKTTDQGL